MKYLFVATFIVVQLVTVVNAFVVPSRTTLNGFHQQARTEGDSSHSHTTTDKMLLSLRSKSGGDDTESSVSTVCWNPSLRKIVIGLSSMGALETAYLTYLKLFTSNGINNLCDSAGGVSSCTTILQSPYANININGSEIPLTLLGFFAYSLTAILTAIPLALPTNKDDEETNRIAILCTTTAMATFSTFLISISYFTFGASCQFCMASAILSISMGGLAWFSGLLPQDRTREGVKFGLGSFATSTVAILLLFFSVDESTMAAYANDMKIMNSMTSTTLASSQPEKDIPPPPITSTSSEQALAIGKDLKELDTRFFGAYWCSHCYEQKQRLGREAMKNVQYIECAKEGLNSQRPLCEERGVPGYPTWEIGGKLYPGEMYLDELEKIIQDAKKAS